MTASQDPSSTQLPGCSWTNYWFTLNSEFSEPLWARVAEFWLSDWMRGTISWYNLGASCARDRNVYAFKWGGLHGKHTVPTWNLGISQICLKTDENQENLCQDGLSQALPDTHRLLTSSLVNLNESVNCFVCFLFSNEDPIQSTEIHRKGNR
jgi:hypothetical protein